MSKYRTVELYLTTFIAESSILFIFLAVKNGLLVLIIITSAYFLLSTVLLLLIVAEILKETNK